MADGFDLREERFIKKPPGLNKLSDAVFDALAKHTAFPWPLMETQCKRLGKDPLQLTRADLALLVDKLAESLGRFAGPEKAQTVAESLRKLC